MAKFILVGRIGEDAKFIKTDNSEFTNLLVAENRDFFDKKSSSWIKRDPYWFDILCFDEIGSKARSLKKGDKVQISGFVNKTKKEVNGEVVFRSSFVASSIYKVQSLKNNEIDNLPDFNSDQEIYF